MDETTDFTSMWAILPPPVRYDTKLSPNAKLLFAEIAAKTNTLGYCWAHNKYFAQALGVSADRISGLIKQLEEFGYISVEYVRTNANKDKRHIYLTPAALLPGVSAKMPIPRPGKNADTGIGKNAEALKENKENKKIGLERPKYMSLEIFKAICQWCGDDGELLLGWMQFADMRQKTHHPIATVATVERACRKIDRLSAGSREYKLGLLHKATDSAWVGFWPLKEGDEGFAPTEANERRPQLWT